MEGTLRFRAIVDTAVVCGPMTGVSGRREGKKEEKGRKKDERRGNAGTMPPSSSV